MIICPCGSKKVKNILDNCFRCEICKLYFKIEPKRKNFEPYSDKVDSGVLATNLYEKPEHKPIL